MGSPRLLVIALICSASAQVQIQSLVELEGLTSDPSPSPDGKTLAFQWCKPNHSCAIYTRPLAGGPITLFLDKNDRAGFPTSPRWSPDRKEIAFTRLYNRWDVRLIVRNAAGGPERELGNVCGRATWSPDGRFLVASKGSEQCSPTLYSVATGQPVRQLAKNGSWPAFSPDGRGVAYGEGKLLKLLRLSKDYQSTGPAVTFASEPRAISEITWTPDGKRVVYQCRGDVPYLRRLEIRPGAQPEPIPGLTAQLSIPQFLPDGSALATETPQHESWWRADLRADPVKVESTSDPGCTVHWPTCSPDGRQRAFISTRTGVSQIWLSNADGTNERPLLTKAFTLDGPDDVGIPMLAGWSPDGKWIAFTVHGTGGNADFRSYLYIVPSSGGAPRRLAKQVPCLNSPVWSPDSKSLYASMDWQDPTHNWPNVLVRIDATDGTVTELAAHGTWPTLSADDKTLYFFTWPTYYRLSSIPLNGGPPEVLWQKPDDLPWFNYCVGVDYLYLFQFPPRDAITRTFTIVRFDPRTRQLKPLAEVAFQPNSAQLSPDERYLYIQQQDDPKSRIVRVRGLY